MTSIPYAFNVLENKEMDLVEYEDYRRKHPYQNSIKILKCVECGDFLTYCYGEHKVPYFKHSPKRDGHFCSLYTKGYESNSVEASIRKRFISEENVTFNFELIYRNGVWKSLVTTPPFSGDALQKAEANKTIICINNEEIPLDKNHFHEGEIKKIGLRDFFSPIKILIKGNTYKKDISYSTEGFDCRHQIFSSLILQEYVDCNQEDYIDLRNIQMFVCKRVSGKIYTGRHYFIFSKDKNFSDLFLQRKAFKVKKILFNSDKNFEFFLFDVVFKTATNDTVEFCKWRNCELIEKDDASILWPPVKTIGNYKKFDKIYNKMYVSFQNDSENIEIKEININDDVKEINCSFFKIANINSTPFIVGVDTSSQLEKTSSCISNTQVERVDNLKKYKMSYFFSNNVLKELLFQNNIQLRKNEKILAYNDPLDRVNFTNTPYIDDKEEEILMAIRYSKDIVVFKDQCFEFLYNRYKNNQLISCYLFLSKKRGFIKSKVLALMAEGNPK